MNRTTDILIAGGGPAGMSAAVVAAQLGAKVTLVDDNPDLGGQLVKQTHRFFGSSTRDAGIRGFEIAKTLVKEIHDFKDKIDLRSDTSVVGFYSPGEAGLLSLEKFSRLEYMRAIVATGAVENALNFENSDLPGVYGAGAVQTLMNVHGIRPGKKIVMIGSGNIGLIVSYQLIQAGVDVVGLVEALPTIGGYLVHASKIRRLGVPIYTSHTIVSANGKDRVESATLVRVDDKFNPMVASRFDIPCDCICLAVGLTPMHDLFQQGACKMVFVPELGGLVPLHDGDMRTTNPNIYVAGDASGIEEATTAILGGRIAGARAYESLYGRTAAANEIVEDARKELRLLRSGTFGERIRWGRDRLLKEIAPC